MNPAFTHYSMPNDEGKGYFKAHTYYILNSEVFMDYGGAKFVFDDCDVKNKNNWICTENYGKFGVINGDYFGVNSHGGFNDPNFQGATVSKFNWAYSWCKRTEMTSILNPMICASMFILPGRVLSNF